MSDHTPDSWQSTEMVCPTCGPHRVEQHPRRSGVTRCTNCKDWLEPASATELGRGRTQQRGSVWLTADRLVTGNRIIPPGRKRAVEIVGQLSDPSSADYFEFACLSANGSSALRLHRSERVEVLHSRTQDKPPASDTTGGSDD